MNANHPSRIQRGFTLIELVIVLAVLGALAAVAVPQLTGLQEEADLAGTATTISSELGNAFATDLANGNVSGGDVDWTNFTCGANATELSAAAPAFSTALYSITGSDPGSGTTYVALTIPSYESSSATVGSKTCYLTSD